MLLDSSVSWSDIDITKYVFYGGAFTVAVDAVIYPMELLKTKLQVDSAASPTLFRATFTALRSTLATEGARGLYKGFFLYTLGGLPSQGAYFLGYNYAKEALVRAGTRADGVQVIPDAAVYLGAGFFADVVAAPLWTPVDVVMQRLQIQGPGVVQYNGVWHAFSHIYKHEGIRGIFRGLGASIITFGPASALWWALYEGTAAYLLRLRSSHLLPSERVTGADAGNVPWVHGLAGFIAGAVSSMLTNPLDIAKTRLQTQHSMIREYESELHAALRDKRERDVAASKARKLHFFGSLQDARERQRDAVGVRKPTRGSSPSDGTRSKAANAATMAASNVGVKPNQAAVMRATAAAATAVGAVRTAADTLRAVTQTPALSTPSASTNVSAAAAASTDGAARRHAEHAPTIRSVPYQSTVSRTPAVIEAAASTAKAAILDAEQERVGRKRRAPNAAALVAAASNDKRGSGHFYPSIAPKLKTNIASILTHIVRTEGAAALVRGMFPRMMLHGPASAATFVCYEQVLRLSRRETPVGAGSAPLR